jgi:flagellar motility protein MotE (MotC chaperone)
MEGLIAGTASQSALADEIGVSKATVCRALKELHEVEEAPEALPVLEDIKKLLIHLNHKKGPHEAELIAYYSHSALSRVVGGYSAATKKNYRKRLEDLSTQISSRITPELRSLILRGGKSTKKGIAAAILNQH